MADSRRYLTASAPANSPQEMYNQAFIPMGYASINAPQAISDQTCNPASLGIGVAPNDSSFHLSFQEQLLPFGWKFTDLDTEFPNSEPAGTTAQTDAGFPNHYAIPENFQESYPDPVSEFLHFEPGGATAQLHAGVTNQYPLPGSYQELYSNVGLGFPDPELVRTLPQFKEKSAGCTVQSFQPYPYIETKDTVSGNTAEPLIHQNPGYMGNPEQGEYNIGYRMPFLGTPRKPGSLQDIPDLGDTSLGKEIKPIPTRHNNEPAYPNNPPGPCKKSQKTASLPRKILQNPRTKGLNKRRHNIQSFNAKEFYDNLPRAPSSWTHNGFEFRYNSYGELDNPFTLSIDQMIDFLYYHPLHKITGRRERGLVLWVQTVPADSGTRYPNQRSDKCRFAECPVSQNTIHKGFFRVAIDEHHHSGIKVDPYHCAGFVHLYCLEKFLDFPSLCKEINVQPDNRLLAEPRNRMAITRDHDALYEIANDFIQNSKKRQPGHWDFKSTLGHLLTEKHLDMEPGSRARKRGKVGGNHLGVHRGDLEEFIRGERKKYRTRNHPEDGFRDEDGPSHRQVDREASVDGQRGEAKAKKRSRDGLPDEDPVPKKLRRDGSPDEDPVPKKPRRDESSDEDTAPRKHRRDGSPDGDPVPKKPRRDESSDEDTAPRKHHRDGPPDEDPVPKKPRRDESSDEDTAPRKHRRDGSPDEDPVPKKPRRDESSDEDTAPRKHHRDSSSDEDPVSKKPRRLVAGRR